MVLKNKYSGRRKSYTVTGIKKVPCIRCGKPSYATWQACANERYHIPVCKSCDIGLNRLALKYFKIPNRELLMKEYEEKVNAL